MTGVSTNLSKMGGGVLYLCDNVVFDMIRRFTFSGHEMTKHYLMSMSGRLFVIMFVPYSKFILSPLISPLY